MEYKGYKIWIEDINWGWRYTARAVATKPGCNTLSSTKDLATRDVAIREIKRLIDNQEVSD
jgi:hypothetical protein